MLSRSSIHSLLIPVLKSYESVMNSFLTNACHLFYAQFYMYSLGDIRFNDLQDMMVHTNQAFPCVVSVVTVYLFAIQLCFLCMDVDSVLSVLLNCFSSDLITDSRPLTKEEEESIPVGKQSMFSYFFFLLLSILYNRNVINYDTKELAIEVFLKLSLTSSGLTSESVEDDIFLSHNPQLAFSVLKEISKEMYDTVSAVFTYDIKKEYLKNMCVFDGYSSFFYINNYIKVSLFHCFISFSIGKKE